MNDRNDLASGFSLEQVLNHVEAALAAGSFDLRDRRKACLTLFLSGLENSRAFVNVSRSPSAFASVANARSALEALVDSRAMLYDELHLRRMHQDFLQKKRNALSAGVKMMQRLKMVDGVGPADWQRQLNALDTEIKDLSDSRVPKKRQEELITEHLDDSGTVLTLWSVLCDVSHNNINSLAIRHLEITEKGEQIVLYAPLDSGLAEAIVVTLASLVVDSAGHFLPFLQSGREVYLANLQRAQAELWWVEPAQAS